MMPITSLMILLLVLFSQASFAQVKVASKPQAQSSQSSAQTASEQTRDSACDTQPSTEGSTVRKGVTPPAARLQEELSARARAGDAAAAWRAALASYRGECRSPNYSEMAAYVQLAHAAGHACATGAFGLMHARGWGVARDIAQARALLDRSIQAGCARAYFWNWLADEYAPNPKARERARTSLEEGASRSEGHSLNALAVLTEVDGQRSEARKLYLRAADAGNSTARMNLARLARYFSQTTEKLSMSSLQLRATSGEVQAQYQLARRLHQGDGISPDYAQALKWYQLAGSKGYPAAQEMLQLVQARLGSVALAKTQPLNLAMMSDLAFVDLANDEANKRRGITQPIEDIDPFTSL